MLDGGRHRTDLLDLTQREVEAGREGIRIGDAGELGQSGPASSPLQRLGLADVADLAHSTVGAQPRPKLVYVCLVRVVFQVDVEDRGIRALKGVPGAWQLYAVATGRAPTGR